MPRRIEGAPGSEEIPSGRVQREHVSERQAGSCIFIPRLQNRPAPPRPQHGPRQARGGDEARRGHGTLIESEGVPTEEESSEEAPGCGVKRVCGMGRWISDSGQEEEKWTLYWKQVSAVDVETH